jgi:mannosyltransferase
LEPRSEIGTPTVPHALQAPPASRAVRRGWTLGLLALALALGAFGLGDKGLWYDEVASAQFALRGPRDWVADHNMALYYALLGAWVRLFGHGEIALRSLSVLFFAASVPIAYLLAEALFGQRVARSAGLLLACNSMLVHFAQEVRGYMLAVLLLLISGLALVRLLERRKLGWALVHGIASGLSLYGHLFALWVAIAQACAVCWLLRRADSPRGLLLLSQGIAGSIALPLLLQAFATGAGQISWIHRPTWRSAWESLVMWSGGGQLLAAAYGAGFLGFSAIALGRSRAARLPESVGNVLVLSWWWVPIALTFGISLLWTPIVHPKYLLVIVPALVIGVAVALDRLPRKLALFALFAVGSLTLHRLHFWYTRYERELWREAVAELARRHQPGDALLFDGMSRDPVDYYVERLGLEQSIPVPIAPARPWGLPAESNVAIEPAAIDASIAAAPRIWMLSNRTTSDELRERVMRTHAVGLRSDFEPNDDDADSVFADSSGRIITLELWRLK